MGKIVSYLLKRIQLRGKLASGDRTAGGISISKWLYKGGVFLCLEGGVWLQKVGSDLWKICSDCFSLLIEEARSSPGNEDGWAGFGSHLREQKNKWTKEK